MCFCTSHRDIGVLLYIIQVCFCTSHRCASVHHTCVLLCITQVSKDCQTAKNQPGCILSSSLLYTTQVCFCTSHRCASVDHTGIQVCFCTSHRDTGVLCFCTSHRDTGVLLSITQVCFCPSYRCASVHHTGVLLYITQVSKDRLTTEHQPGCIFSPLLLYTTHVHHTGVNRLPDYLTPARLHPLTFVSIHPTGDRRVQTGNSQAPARQ